MIDVNIEIAEQENGDYETPLQFDGKDRINIKLDNGSANTVIAAKVLEDDIPDELIREIEQKLKQRYQVIAETEGKASYQKVFESATGDPMTGYLSEARNVRLGGCKLDRFYYYFVPRNKRAIALLGNNFLRFCEYTHPIEGSIFITKIDEEAYCRYYSNAITSDELSELIDEVIVGVFPEDPEI